MSGFQYRAAHDDAAQAGSQSRRSMTGGGTEVIMTRRAFRSISDNGPFSD
jgi:hypothetical protein